MPKWDKYLDEDADLESFEKIPHNRQRKEVDDEKVMRLKKLNRPIRQNRPDKE